MFEQFNQIKALFDSSKPYLLEYLDRDQVEDFATQLAYRTANHQPIVMVYGVYNAGKSTLINALLGREEAEVGDIPKTTVVSRYQLGDVQLFDSPGIDAPIEHEKISREQLQKSDAVVFVLSSAGVVEEQQTYDEIRRILQDGKSMLLVVNNKNAYLTDSPSYIHLIDTFRSNLYEQFATDEALLTQLDALPIFLVNAQLAFNAKKMGRDKLVEFSQITALEKALSRLFLETDSAHVAKTLATQLGQLLAQALLQAQQQNKSSDLAYLQTLITHFNEAQQAIGEKVKAYANKTKPALKSELYALAQQGDSQAMQATLEQWQTQQSQYFERQLKQALIELDAQSAQTKQLMFGTASVSIDSTTPSANSEELGLGMTELFTMLKEHGLKLGLHEQFAQDGLVTVLKQGKSWFPTLFKGVGNKTMEKMAGKVVPYIGPLIDTAVAVYDYYQADAYEQHQLQQERQRLEHLNHQVNVIVVESYQAFQDQVGLTLREVFKPLVADLTLNLEQLSKEAGSVEYTVAYLKQIQQQLVHF